MRPMLQALALCVSAVVVQAQTPPATSERTQQALRDRLPRYDPAASDAARKARAEAAARKAAAPTETEEGVVVLPEFQVRERKMAQPSADDWLRSQEVTQKAMRAKAAEMNALEMALNRWHIPFLTPSFAARARAEYEDKKRREEMDRLERLNTIPLEPGK